MRIYVCWRIDDEHVTPPKLPGGPGQCEDCGSIIYIADRTRDVMAAKGAGMIVCNVCLERKYKHAPYRLIVDTPRQREITKQMGKKREPGK